MVEKIYHFLSGVVAVSVGFVAMIHEPFIFWAGLLSVNFIARYLLKPTIAEHQLIFATTDKTELGVYLAGNEKLNYRISVVASACFLVMMGAFVGVGYLAGDVLGGNLMNDAQPAEGDFLAEFGAAVTLVWVSVYWLAGLWASRVDVMFGPQSGFPNYGLLIEDDSFIVYGVTTHSEKQRVMRFIHGERECTL